MLPNHSLLPARELCLLTKPCLLEALVLGGANQVTGMCGCLVAKAISWSSRRRETRRGECGHPARARWSSPARRAELGVGAAHLQIDARARPGVRRGWAELVLHLKGGELPPCPEHPQRGNRTCPTDSTLLPQTTEHFRNASE